MFNILSIQSHVAYGYVGNRAAVFPLQRLGHDVTAINTVQFSNHTGYGEWEGDILSQDHIQRIIKGLEGRDVLKTFHGLLTGYMGDASLGELMIHVAERIRQQSQSLLYCCDPVIGDVGRGMFVKPEVADFFRDQLITHANIITPNLYELRFLSGYDCETLNDVIHACQQLRHKGPEIVLVTSMIFHNTPNNTIAMLVNTGDGSWIVETPKFDMNPAPNGAGDVTAALFLAKFLQYHDVIVALKETAGAIYSLFEHTFRAGTRELQLIRAQQAFVAPEKHFSVRVVDDVM